MASSSSSPITPVDKLLANLSSFEEDPNLSSLQPVVLVSTGAYNPVHREHVHVFELAKQHLEEQHDVRVVGAYLSPSHRAYVRAKLGAQYIDTEHRLAMARLATASSSFVMVDSWEASQDGFRDFPEVCSNLFKTLLHELAYIDGIQRLPPSRPLHKLKPLRVFYVCGSDHAAKCHLYNGINDDIGVVAIQRYGHRLSGVKSNDNCIIIDADEAPSHEVSSSLVRKLLATNTSVAHLVPPSVDAYLREHHILNYSAAPPSSAP